MTYHFADDRFTSPELYAPEATPVARFKLYDQHDLIVRRTADGLIVTCDTCSISETASKAVIFAYENGVFRMTIDGANFKRQ